MHCLDMLLPSIGISESERCNAQKRLFEVVKILDKGESKAKNRLCNDGWSLQSSEAIFS